MSTQKSSTPDNVAVIERPGTQLQREDGFPFRLFREPSGSLSAVMPIGGPLPRSDTTHAPAKLSDIPPFPHNLSIGDLRMSFSLFVKNKFIPEHVARKTLTGQRHYQAILKHLLRPETVNRVFNPQNVAHPRLIAVPDWPYLDDVPLCDIRSDHVCRLLGSASDHGYSSQTIKHIKNVLFAVISHAQREGCFVGANPVSHVKVPLGVTRVRHSLNVCQTRDIVRRMHYPDQEIALFCLTTDMTLTEICELEWKRVNLGYSEIYYEGEFLPPLSIAVRSKVDASSMEGCERGRHRTISITEPLLSHLRKLRGQVAKKRGATFVLTSERGGPIPRETVNIERLKPIRKTLGIPWLSWQALRRARVSMLRECRTELAERVIDRIVSCDRHSTNDSRLDDWLNRESKTNGYPH